MPQTRRLNPQWTALVMAGVNPCPYFSLQSMALRGLEWGRAELEIDLQTKHLQPFGIVHGGVLASVVDAACFWACYTQIEAQQGMTTVEIKLNYLAPVTDGVVARASGHCLKLGRSLGLGEASVFDDQGKLLAHGTSTVMVVDGLALAAQGQLPPKFLE